MKVAFGRNFFFWKDGSDDNIPRTFKVLKIKSKSLFIYQASAGNYVVRKNEQGKLCGLRFSKVFF